MVPKLPGIPERQRSLLFLLLPVLLTLLCLKKISDYDIWYHLSIGRQIFGTGSIPATEFLVYTLEGEPTVFHAWGYGVISFLIQESFGIWGLSLANALLGGMILTIFYQAALNKDRDAAPVALLLLVPLFLLVNFRFVYRPEMVTYLFLGVELLLLERFLSDRNWRYLYAVPPLCLLNNLHPSSVLLLIVLGVHLAQYLFERVRERSLAGAEVVKLAGVFVAALCASLLNPYGYLPLLLPFQMTGSKDYVSQVVEMVPTLQTVYKWPFLVVGAMAVLSLLADRRRMVANLLMLLFFGYIGFGYVRSFPFFVLATYPLIVQGGRHLLARLARRNPVMVARCVGCVGAVALAALLVSVVRQPAWGCGIVEARFPVKAADLISYLKPPGRILNSEESGGYLGWRLLPHHYQVAVDGRHFRRDRSLVLTQGVFDANQGWERVLADLGVTTVFTPATSPMTGVLVELLIYLDQSEDWVLLSAEPAGLLFGNRGSVRAFDGLKLPDQNQVWRQVLSESWNVPCRPGSANALLSMGIAYFNLRQFDLSVKYLRQYVAYTPGDREAAKMLGVLESGVRVDEAALVKSSKPRVF